MGQISQIANVPDFRVVLAGEDLTSRIRPRLISLGLTEKRGDEADQLDLAIDDSDGAMAIPRTGVTLSVQLGWLRGSEVRVGLVDKGSFIVDEVTHAGPPDVLTIRARAADFTSEIRTRREGSWHGTTIGAVVREVAARNRLTPRCADDLAAIAVPTLAQSRESDIALLRRLGREQDAIATIKAGCLLFARIGAGTSAGGTSLGAIVLRRRDGDRHSYTIERRDEAGTIETSWHDRDDATRKTVRIGSGGKTRRLSRTYASEQAATAAAKAEQGRAARAPVKISVECALGRPEIMPDARVALSGFKRAIDGTAWCVAELTHSLSKDSGFRTSMLLETTGTG